MIQTRIITTEQKEKLEAMLEALGIDLMSFLNINNLTELIENYNALKVKNNELEEKIKNLNSRLAIIEQTQKKSAIEQLFGSFDDDGGDIDG